MCDQDKQPIEASSVAAAYSDTTNEVLTLAFERLRGTIPALLLDKLKGLAAEGRLDNVLAVKALLDEEVVDAEDR
jgi:hypothetical protein